MSRREGWRVEIARPAARDIRRLDAPIRARVLAAIESLRSDAPADDIRRLAGVSPAEWRLRVGDWRVRFTRDAATRTVLILRVLPRSSAYRA